jgi:hypothetical protein
MVLQSVCYAVRSNGHAVSSNGSDMIRDTVVRVTYVASGHPNSTQSLNARRFACRIRLSLAPTLMVSDKCHKSVTE